MIQHGRVGKGDERVRLIALPRYNEKAWAAWQRFVASDDVFGLDVESTAFEELGVFDPSIKMRLIQFGNRHEAWALDPTDVRWRRRIIELLSDETKRFVSHNATFDTTRVLFEFGIDLGDRSIDTLPMASLLWPGKTARKDLKNLCSAHIDRKLADADRLLHARFIDLFYASKPRKTRLLPVSFKPGVSPCRAPKRKGQDKCVNVSYAESLCGYCFGCYLSRKISKPIETWGWKHIAIDDPIFLRYAGMDALYVRRLLDILARLIREAKMGRLSKTEQRIKHFTTAQARRGMRVDLEWTESVLGEVEEEFRTAAFDVEATTGLKPRSNKMQDWFRSKGVRVTSLDKKHLPDLIEKYGEEPEVGEALAGLAEVSRLSNLLTNLRTIHAHATDGDGFVHPNINTLQAHTGRMSFTKPAVQTLAKSGEKGTRLRGCFIARDGFVLAGADYDSQEIRIGAALSRDPAMLRIVMEGLNQHVLTSESIFAGRWVDKATTHDLYDQAKTLDFAQQFGAMPRKIAKTLDIPEREAFLLWQKWRQTYAGLVAWTDQQARKRFVRNPFGRVIPRDPFRDYANGNYLIQSTGRDILGSAMCRLADEGWADYFWLEMHDELLMEVPEDRAEEAAEALTRCMSTELRGVPIPAEGEVLGSRWHGLG